MRADVRSLAIGLVLGCAVRAAAQTTAADLIAAAQVQVRDHNLDSAAVLLHQVVRPDAPGTLQERIEGWLLLGMVHYYAGRDSATADAFREVVMLAPDFQAPGLAARDSTLARMLEQQRAQVQSGVVPLDAEADVVQERPELISHPDVQYPEALLRRGVTGRVLLAAVIDTAGRVEPASVAVLEATDSAFISPVREMLLAARYRPGRAYGRAVRMRVRVPADFDVAAQGPAADTSRSGSRAPGLELVSCVPRCPPGVIKPRLTSSPRVGELTGDLPMRGYRGTVIVDFVVGTDGYPEAQSITPLSGTQPLLARRLVDFVRTFSFQPALANGGATRARVQMRFEFRVSGSTAVEVRISGP